MIGAVRQRIDVASRAGGVASLISADHRRTAQFEPARSRLAQSHIESLAEYSELLADTRCWPLQNPMFSDRAPLRRTVCNTRMAEAFGSVPRPVGAVGRLRSRVAALRNDAAPRRLP